MTLRWVWDWWVVLLVVGAMLAVVGHGWWRARQARERTEWSWLRRGAIVLCLAVVMVGPTIPAEETEVGTNADVFFVVDRTGSMAAEDYGDGQPRLDGVRADMREIVEALPGARFSIIAFDSQATRELPLTTDGRSVRTWVDTLRQEVTYYSGGSSIDRPRQVLADALVRAEEAGPGNVRLVFVLSDGENTQGDTTHQQVPGDWADSAGLTDGGAVLGYGTPEGGTMRSYDGSDRTGPGTTAPHIVDDATGQAAVSRIDETNLRSVADRIGIDYLRRTAPGGLTELLAGIDLQEIARADGRQSVDIHRDVWWPAAYVLVGLLVWEAVVVGGRLRTAISGPTVRTRTDGGGT